MSARPLLSRKLRYSLACSLGSGACALVALPVWMQSPQPLRGSVHGTVAASLPQGGGRTLVPLPNVAVTVVDAAGSASRGQTITTLSGRFATPLQPAGTYRVCAKAAGFTESCSDPITVVKESVALKQFLVLKPQGAVVYGQVTLKDGTPGVRLEAATHTTQGATQVSLAASGGHVVAGPVSVNASATYILPAVKPGTGLVLSARYEEAKVSQEISVASSDVDGAKQVNLVLPSSSPVIESVTMTVSGKAISSAVPGSTVVITFGVKDEHPGALHYRYSTNSTGLSAKDSPSVAWKLPTTSAANILFFEVSNGRGGVLRSSITVPVDPAARQREQGPLPVPPGSPQESLLDQARKNALTPLRMMAHSGIFIDPTLLMDRACLSESACELEAPRYYAAIGAPASFKAWKNKFGFSLDPLTPAPGELRTTYYNNGDLQFGRDMHCIDTISTKACYVSNYGDGVTTNPGADPQTAIANAAANQHRIASVAMTSSLTVSRTGLVADDVQFYVYNVDAMDENDGMLINAAALDHEGNKAVPGLCMTCHGGQYDPGFHLARHSSFLPFDTPSFIFSTTQPSLQEPAQRDTFRAMNIFTVNASLERPTIGALVTDWYDFCGLFSPGCGIDDVLHPAYPNLPCSGLPTNEDTCGWPSTWNGVPAQPVYQSVPRRYCRTCHVALSNFLNVQNFDDWKSQCSTIKSLVFASNYMPFAEVPYNAFSGDPSAQTALSNFLAPPGCP